MRLATQIPVMWTVNTSNARNDPGFRSQPLSSSHTFQVSGLINPTGNLQLWHWVPPPGSRCECLWARGERETERVKPPDNARFSVREFFRLDSSLGTWDGLFHFGDLSHMQTFRFRRSTLLHARVCCLCVILRFAWPCDWNYIISRWMIYRLSKQTSASSPAHLL